MKKIFTLAATALVALSANAQDVIDLSAQTYDAENSSNDLWKFTGTDITIVPTGGRAAGPKTFPDVSVLGEDGSPIYAALNFKNNGEETIMLPVGTKLYRIEMFGYSQGDNFEYIYAYGSDGNGGYEWTEPIGKLTGAENNAAMAAATYPLDPCGFKQPRVAESTKEIGYCVAAIDFGDQPYEDKFAMTITGNNQANMNYRLYLSRAAADASTRTTGSAPSGLKDEPGWILEDPNSIKSVAAKSKTSGKRYNLLGQEVGKDYKGYVYSNGHKMLSK